MKLCITSSIWRHRCTTHLSGPSVSFLVTRTELFFFFLKEEKKHSATASVLHVKCLWTHTLAFAPGAAGRGDCGPPTAQQQHPFMPLLRLGVIKRKRVLRSVWFFMKWNARPSCWKGSRRCSWARLACDCGSGISLSLFTRCSGWDYVLPVFVPVCIGAFPQRSDCDAAQTLGGNDWLLMGWRSSCRPNRWGAPLSLCWCSCNCSSLLTWCRVVTSYVLWIERAWKKCTNPSWLLCGFHGDRIWWGQGRSGFPHQDVSS